MFSKIREKEAVLLLYEEIFNLNVKSQKVDWTAPEKNSTTA